MKRTLKKEAYKLAGKTIVGATKEVHRGVKEGSTLEDKIIAGMIIAVPVIALIGLFI